MATGLVAFAERVLFARAWSELGTGASAFYAGDARAFLAYAAHLVDGRLFDNGVPFHPPGWPFVLALFYRAAGFAPLAGRPVEMMAVKLGVGALSALAVVVTALAAGRAAGLTAMILAALLGSFHFGHLVVGTVPTGEALQSLIVALALVAAPRWFGAADERPRRVRAAALGALAGAGTLVRPEFAFAAIAFGVLAWRVRATSASRPLEVAAYAATFALVLTPSTVWNWRNVTRFNAANAARLPGPLPRFAPVTSYGAFNFAAANHPYAEGGPNSDHPLLDVIPPGDETLASGGLDLAHPAVHRLYVDGWRIGAGWLVDHPADAAALVARRLSMASGVFALGYLHANVPAGIEGTRRRVDMIDPRRRWLWLPHVALMLAGAVVLRRRPDVCGPALVLLLTPFVSVAAFYGYVRLVAGYLPAVWLFQAAALTALLERRSRRSPARGSRIVLAMCLLAAALLVVEAAAAALPRHARLDGPRDTGGRLNDDETVEIRGSVP